MPPVNDNWADAIDLGSADSGSVTGTNVDATLEPGEPDIDTPSDGVSGTATVWWKWLAPADGLLEVDTFGSRWGADPTQTLDTVLDIWVGSSLAGLVPRANNDDAGSEPNNPESFGRTSQITDLVVSAGSLYYFRVNGYDATQVGDIALSWTRTDLPPPPPPIFKTIARSDELFGPSTWDFDSSPFDTGSPFSEVVGFAFTSGTIVAIGNGGPTLVATSTDGISWNTQASPFDGIAVPTCICHVGSKFIVGLAGGSSALMSSVDGITWVAESTPIDESITGVSPIVTGIDGGSTEISIFTSTDGENWKPKQSEMDVNLIAGHQPGNVMWNPTWQIWFVSTWADVGGVSGSTVFISPDSEVWIPKHSGADAQDGTISHGLCVADSIGAGALVGTFTNEVIGGTSTSVAAVSRSADGFIGSSTTVPIADFSRSPFTQFQRIEAMCVTNTHVVAVGSGWYWSANSVDGLTWSLGGVPGGVGSGDGHAHGVATNGSRVVAVGQFQDDTGAFGAAGYIYAIATSEDNGATWTFRSSPLDTNQTFPAGTGGAVAWNGSVFIAVGSNIVDGVMILKSYDGITWVSMILPAGMNLQPAGVCFGAAANKWVIVGRGNILTATGIDPTTWNIAAGAPGYPYTTLPDDTQLLAVAWSPDLGKFMAVGFVFSANTIVMGDNKGSLYTSVDDMVSWQSNFRFDTHTPSIVKFLQSSGQTNRWIAGCQSDGVNPMTAASPDGWNWTAHPTPWDSIVDARINAFAWNGIELVAVGHMGTETFMAIDFRDDQLPDLHTAPGGWTSLATPFDGSSDSEIFDVTFASEFVAAGVTKTHLPTLALYSGGGSPTDWSAVAQDTLKTGIGKAVISLFGFSVRWLAGGIWKPFGNILGNPLRMGQRRDTRISGHNDAVRSERIYGPGTYA